MTHHPFHQTKFRWTENLTSRFIQLRKENGNLFTGRKYSAQAGWEHILQQMRREFPTIMADVHYRVLKKKWSNLLQQYKELKNPVHGDRNKSDDVSWPFYGAIDEVLGFGSSHRRNEDPDFDSVNPHEFLCLSVTPEEPASPPDDVKSRQDSEIDIESNSVIALHQRIRNLRKDFSIEIEKLPRTMTTTTTTTTTRRLLGPRSSVQSRIADVMNCQDASEALVSRLPPATELSIKTVRTSSSVPSIRVKDFSKDIRDSPPDLSPITAAPGGRFLRDVLAVVKQNGIHHSSSVIEDVEEVEEEEDEEEEGEGEEEEDDDDGAEEEEEDDDNGEEEEGKKLHGNEIVGSREEEEIEEIEEEEEELEEEDDEGDDEVLLDEEVRIRPRKIRRIERPPPPPPLSVTERERGLERRLDEFIEYTKRRDEENYRIMTRILNAVEKIADKQ